MTGDEALDALVATIATTRPEDLSASVLDVARRIVADCLICGLAGAPYERSATFRAVLARDGGVWDATVLGDHRMMPAPHAAAANAEAMNLLDADDSFLSGPHHGALVVPVALAEAEANGEPWARCLLGVILGFEVTARMSFAWPGPAPTFAAGLPAVGTAVAALLASGSHASVVGHALGLSMRSAPGPVPIVHATGELRSTKYAPYGAIASQAVLAARLAVAGYAADHRYLVMEPGFFHTQGVPDVDPADVLARTAERGWWIEETSLKPYPSYRLAHPAVDLVRELATSARAEPGTIERIDVWLDPRNRILPFLEAPPRSIAANALAPIRTAMHLPYTLALAALGVPAGPRWSAPETLRDPSVWDVAARVVLHPEPACTLEEVAARVDPRSRVSREACARVRLTVGGAAHEAEQWGADGDPWNPNRRPGWEWLVRKAESFGADPGIVRRVRDVAVDDGVALAEILSG